MNSKALLAEFIGTFALIFVGVGAIASNYIVAVKMRTPALGEGIDPVTGLVSVSQAAKA